MKTSIAVALLLALPAGAMAQTPSASTQSMLSQYAKLNEKCRGGSGDAPATLGACDQREKLYQEIVKAGWCWGPDDVYGYQKRWIQCQAKSKSPQPAETALDLDSIANKLARELPLSPSFKNVEFASDNRSFTLTINYSTDVDVKEDTRMLATAFVKYLVSVGRDPTSESDKRPVHVCGMHDGLTTVTGKPGVNMLGCSHYNPHKDAVVWDGV